MAAEKNIPEIRFKGFEGEWNGQYVGNLFEIITDFVAAGSFEDLSKNVTYQSSPDFAQLVRTTDLKSNFTNKNYVYIDEKAFKYLWRVNLNSECVILPNIGNCGEVYLVTPKILPHKNNVLGPNAIYARSISNDNKFLSFSLSQDIFQKSLKNIISPNGQTKFNKTELKTLEVNIPTLPEQTQIGTYFQNLDSLISQHQRKYDKLLTVKKAMLEKMFPKEGADVPEIRFKGFEGKWEKKKLEDICRIGDIDHRMPQTVNEGIPYLMTGDFIGLNNLDFENSKLISLEDYEQLAKKIKPEFGDILFARYASVGAVRYVETRMKFLISYSCAILKPNDKINGRYLFYNLQSSVTQYQIELDINTGSQRNIGIDSLKKLFIQLPTDIEQTKIGAFFQNLDTQISQHQKQLEKLKNLKKACLEKMFV